MEWKLGHYLPAIIISETGKDAELESLDEHHTHLEILDTIAVATCTREHGLEH